MAHAVMMKLHLGAHVQSGVVAHRDEAQTAGRKATMKVLEGRKDVCVREKMRNRVIASDYNVKQTPVVCVDSKPNGSPMASTFWPTRM